MSDQLRPRSSRSKLSTLARHGRLKKSNPVTTVFKFLAAALAVLMVSSVSVAAIAAYDVASSVKPGVHLENEVKGKPAQEFSAIKGGVNLLLVGSDSRKGQPAVFGAEDATGDLNDVTMLLHISEDHSNASVISFPRDMYVPIPGCPDGKGGTYDAMSSQKINTTLTYGGLACTVLTVEALTGLKIPYAAEVQFSGVMAMSTAVGGVEVCVAEDIEDKHTDTYLKAGKHTLQGLAALQFLRTRHGIGDGSDLTRINNQQVFMSALLRTIKSSATLSDPTKVYSLAKAATANMQLSTSLNNVDTLISIALALKDIDLNKVIFVQVPTGNVDSGVIPIQPDFDDLFTAVASDQPLQLGGSTGRGATVDPNAPATPAPTATPTPTPGAPVTVLPDTATGQTAGEFTCSVGRTLNNQ
ncbi:LCP family protein [Cryobacterium tagatosivorans]|uniref:LytR family transcriptional regulator n=1 Tax=Cryobacterium tagatosivorans TaxID=1259199 RepID=A0A4R8UKA6_9MICO|nr:LCP family protein [Cryobacterium tagatosivorans]TFB56759.1 LytR family transcriptional regulator [Cryobacterium tagatosivorans]